MRKSTKIAIEDRQQRCFDLSVAGFNNIAIGKLLGTHRETVAHDIAAETTRRGAERAADRAAMIELSVSAYEKILSDSSLRVSALQAAANAEPDPHVAVSLRSIIPREILGQLRAREQLSRAQGLDAPLQIDLTMNREVEGLRAKLWAAEQNLRHRIIAEEREKYLSGESSEVPQC